MTYRNTLIERTRQFTETSEPAVLDYLQMRNRQCLYEWQVRRAQHALSSRFTQFAEVLGSNASRTVA